VSTETTNPKPKKSLRNILVVLGVLIVAAAVAIGFLLPGYLDNQDAEDARVAAPEAAARQAEAMLGYQFDTVEAELPKAADGLTGSFKDEYAQLIKEVIIPGAQE
jgi:Mce-associated membrane protein